MEREQYQNQIKDLLQAVETLLKSNTALGERVAQLEKVAEAHEDLKVRYAKQEGYHNIWITVVNRIHRPKTYWPMRWKKCRVAKSETRTDK